MLHRRFLRSLGSASVACLVAAAILTGCSDTTPASPDSDPLGNNSTVQVSDPVTQQEANDVRENAQKNSKDTVIVTVDQASETAAQQYPNGEVLGVNMDYDRDDSLSYECIVRSNGRVYVVVIDPQDGSVKEKREIANHYYTTVVIIRTIYVKIPEVKQRAVRLVRGDVVEMNLEEVEGRPTYIVVLLTSDNRYVTIYLDAESGKERKLPKGGKCDNEDPHKNKRGRGHYRHGKGKGYGHHYHCHCKCDDDGNDTTDGGPDTTGISSKIITQDSARAIVRTMFDSVQITKTELEVKDSTTAFYELTLNRDSSTYEVKLDAFTGGVVEIKQTGGDFQNSEFRPVIQGGDSLVALSVARTAALAQAVGTVESWKLEYDKTAVKWIYSFDINVTATSQRKTVKVDAKTGMVIV